MKKYTLFSLVFTLALLTQVTSVLAISLSGIASNASDITTNLSLGSSGQDVATLQTFLEANGFLKLPEGVSNGYFGTMTRTALASYQTIVGLPAFGYFGTLTKNKIREIANTPVQMNPIPEQTTSQASSTSQSNIIENGKNISNLSKSVEAFEKSGLTSILTGTESFTVFAPTNDAFAKIPSVLLSYVFDTKNVSVLKSIIKYHIVAGTYTLDKLYDGEVLVTLNGNTITINKKNGVLTVNGKALVSDSGVSSKNGIIYTLDSVLIPSVFGVSF